MFHNRPLALSCAFFLLSGGATCFLYTTGKGTYFPVFVLSVLMLGVLAFAFVFCRFAFLRINRKRRAAALFTVAAVVLFALLGTLRIGLGFGASYEEATRLSGQTGEYTVTVLETESSSVGYSRYRVKVTGETGSPVYAILECDGISAWMPGDVLCLYAEFYPVDEVFEDAAYALSDGYYIAMAPTDGRTENDESDSNSDSDVYAPAISLSDAKDRSLLLFLRRQNCLLSERLRLLCGREEGGLAAAILLGNRSYLSSELTRDFSGAGLSHLLALSGLHMGILIGTFAFLLRKAGLPKRIRMLLQVILTVLFLALTGFSMSACRAGLMLMTVSLFGFFYREPDRLTVLFSSVTVILLCMPSAILSVGLWMSFLAVLGLLTVSPVLEGRLASLRAAAVRVCSRIGASSRTGASPRKGKKSGREGFASFALLAVKVLFRALSLIGSTLIANLFVLPVLYIAFGEFPLFAVLSNLLALPMAPVFLVLSLLTLLFGGLPLFGPALSFWTRFCGRYLGKVAGLLTGSVSLRYTFSGWFVALAFLPVLLFLVFPRRQTPTAQRTSSSGARGFPKRAGWILFSAPLSAPLSAVLLFALSVGVTNLCTGNTVSVSCGKATAGEVLTATNGGHGVLFDLSDGSSSGYADAKAAAKSRAVTVWDAVVLTHYHRKQIPTVVKFCRSSYVECVYLPPPETQQDREILGSLCDRLTSAGIRYALYSYEDEPEFFGKLTFDLSERVFLERSSQPLYVLTLNVGEEKLTYLPSSVEESALAPLAHAAAESSTCLIYGSDGPLRREVFRIPEQADRLRDVLLSGEDAQFFLSPISRRRYAGILRDAANGTDPDYNPPFLLTAPG